MPRVKSQKANKDYPDQGIAKGDTYYKWSFRFGGTHKSLTYPRPSQLTQSKLSDPLAQQEAAEDMLGERDTTPAECSVAIGEAADAVTATEEEYREAAEPFGGEGENNERADACAEWAQALQQLADEYADWEPVDQADDFGPDEAKEAMGNELGGICYEGP